MTGTLFDISEDIRLLMESIEATESDDECLELVEDFLAKREGDLESKVDGYCIVIQEKLAMFKARKEESKRLRELADTDENTAKRLKDMLKHVMLNILQRPKIETKRFKLNVQNSGGVQAMEIREGLDLSKVNQTYIVNTPSIDTEALRADLEAREKEIEEAAKDLIPEGEDGHEESKARYDEEIIRIDTEYKDALEIGWLKPRGKSLVIR